MGPFGAEYPELRDPRVPEFTLSRSDRRRYVTRAGLATAEQTTCTLAEALTGGPRGRRWRCDSMA
jgi:hypothetical protein